MAASGTTARPVSAGKPFWTTWKPFALAWLLTLVLAPATMMLRDDDRFAPLLLTFPIAVSLAAAQRYAEEWLPWGWAMLFQLPVYTLVALAAARRSRLKAAAIGIASVHLAAVVLGSPWSWGPSLGDFSRRLRERAGADGRDCGVVAFDHPHLSAVVCARDALADGTAFLVGFQQQGIDSTIYVGLARPAGRDLVAVHWDSDASGGGNLVPLSTLYELPCRHPSIQDERGGPGIECDPLSE